MEKNKPYKYLDIPTNTDVVFLLVIKPLHWTNNPEDTKCGDSVPVGAVTWVSKLSSAVRNSKNKNSLNPDCSVHLENNRYASNYDPSCFELLLTSKQNIR